MPSFELFQGGSMEEIGVNIREMIPGMFPGEPAAEDAGAGGP
jgi:hypothetical protein